jgi:hypothetical protein
MEFVANSVRKQNKARRKSIAKGRGGEEEGVSRSESGAALAEVLCGWGVRPRILMLKYTCSNIEERNSGI